MQAEETHSWRNVKHSLERPYKDDSGQLIPTLYDITSEGDFIYEPRDDRNIKLGERFRRIFLERGVDFFDSDPETRYIEGNGDNKKDNVDIAEKQEDVESKDAATDDEEKIMTPEKLFQMRTGILPRLHIALGEMSHARDLLTLLLSSSILESSKMNTQATASILGRKSALPEVSLSPSLKPGLLTASTVSSLPPILSVQAFDAQLVTGGKDDALRKASDVLKVAAEGVERTTSRTEEYWADALRLRRGNWELIPAPLPLGSSVGKGTDKTARDFLVSYGLESSPPIFRRAAIAHMAFYSTPSEQNTSLVFPHRDRIRLRVTLSRKTSSSETTTCHSHVHVIPDDTLHGAIKGAQKEVVEKEIFAELVKEAGNLPTASARVSERLIAIDAAQDVELRFELIDEDLLESFNIQAGSSSDSVGHAFCDLIAYSLPVLLLRLHKHAKAVRLKLLPKHPSGVPRSVPAPQLLQPIIELLQYHVFLNRIHAELTRAVSQLNAANVPVGLRFECVAETGQAVLNALLEGREKIGGEAVLRNDGKHSVRFTFTSPSTLTALLSQATIPIATIPQLVQLLGDEIERSLLEEICEIGIEACQSLNGTWFVDDLMSRAIGRWEGCVLDFNVKCKGDLSLDCHAYQLLHSPPLVGRSISGTEQLSPLATYASIGPAKVLTYEQRNDKSLGLFAWAKQVIEDALSKG